MFNRTNWIRIALINFAIVALLGVLMRYKIGFDFPYLDQKHLQHAHSHFAFYGWVSHLLMVLMVSYIELGSNLTINRKYHNLIFGNLVCGYGMLFSFILWGYHPISITFSTGSILISYLFTFFFLRDSKSVSLQSGASRWFRAALIFNVLASIGTFVLAYLMVNKLVTQNLYLASVYFYLHFMYNGWFFFACIGLLIVMIQKQNITSPLPSYVFWMFTLSCFPAYVLSALWIPLPNWVYYIVVVSALVQLSAWMITLNKLRVIYTLIQTRLTAFFRLVIWVLSIAMSIKFLLQTASVIPSVAKLAFGFRPIIIAYLHLVLLGIVSVFLIGIIHEEDTHEMAQSSSRVFGKYVLLCGIYATEFILGIQGIASFAYIRIPFVNEFLFILATIMFIGILMIFFTHLRGIKKNDIPHL